MNMTYLDIFILCLKLFNSNFVSFLEYNWVLSILLVCQLWAKNPFSVDENRCTIKAYIFVMKHYAIIFSEFSFTFSGGAKKHCIYPKNVDINKNDLLRLACHVWRRIWKNIKSNRPGIINEFLWKFAQLVYTYFLTLFVRIYSR